MRGSNQVVMERYECPLRDECVITLYSYNWYTEGCYILEYCIIEYCMLRVMFTRCNVFKSQGALRGGEREKEREFNTLYLRIYYTLILELMLEN